jgi:hypothetical protein
LGVGARHNHLRPGGVISPGDADHLQPGARGGQGFGFLDAGPGGKQERHQQHAGGGDPCGDQAGAGDAVQERGHGGIAEGAGEAGLPGPAELLGGDRGAAADSTSPRQSSGGVCGSREVGTRQPASAGELAAPGRGVQRIGHHKASALHGAGQG